MRLYINARCIAASKELRKLIKERSVLRDSAKSLFGIEANAKFAIE
ncbi:hypothetical protein ACP_1326 [Acidobacterium capsulatum ATCC 51196]|uniref:Uncharacterized protein n=1 Tax=Acidobacterium capsulatum (strain ATCC 51196 / DSM 11244 / BCRC 80197 / JCM 7670 / NBRC 15755 / NCIMB 13165 / 161) TaxID=240015 RepID=C1F5F2_ACIC5|nr:hypothetical protein ACP_1326 [Acidobacterium capsulatum ATCC 51196]